ncbi:hypothetical protein NDU88_006149 [Pleurodeles waltl]|uniref:Integrase catalytic domain-containing protein n=1 Tax=Pleurodeles waltl TaxID=8319 RepID=A0AAV7N013_PLEWA|nr:hypothetical protein NDU88_006149 [Pleurodeles waltl]
MVSNNGTQFASDAMVIFLRKHDVKHLRVPLYSPVSNGLLERANTLLKDGTQTVIANNVNIAEYLQQTIWSFGITPHSTTGIVLFVLLRGRKPKSALNPTGLDEEIGNKCWGHVKMRQNASKKHFDKVRHVKDVEVIPGDWVLLKKPVKATKGQSKYSKPTKIVRVPRRAVLLEDKRWWNKF